MDYQGFRSWATREHACSRSSSRKAAAAAGHMWLEEQCDHCSPTAAVGESIQPWQVATSSTVTLTSLQDHSYKCQLHTFSVGILGRKPTVFQEVISTCCMLGQHRIHLLITNTRY